MRRSIIFLLGLATIFIAAGIIDAMDKGPNEAIVGIWRGEYENLPAATLNVTDEAGPLQGAMLFYLIRRNEGKPSTSSPGIPEPLFNPQFDGKKLTFQLSHRHAHAETTSDPPVTFHLELTGPDEAKLVRIPQDGPSYVRMVREKRWARNRRPSADRSLSGVSSSI
jgi:hypothetical protein